jgi:hypothetical protein
VFLRSFFTQTFKNWLSIGAECFPDNSTQERETFFTELTRKLVHARLNEFIGARTELNERGSEREDKICETCCMVTGVTSSKTAKQCLANTYRL